MATRVALLMLLALSLVIVVTGCPKQTDTEVAKTDTTVQPVPPPVAGGEAAKTESGASGDATKAETGTAADAESLMQDRCTQCHGIDKVEKERGKADAEEWAKIVKQMQQNAEKMKKTPITDEEAKQILDHILAAAAQ